MTDKPSDTDKITIQKIIGYCNQIEHMRNKFGDTFEDYISDLVFQFSSSMFILQIGELATQISEDFKNQHSEIDWNQIKSFCNIHDKDYENMRFDVIWEILTEDIPALKKSLQTILEVM